MTVKIYVCRDIQDRTRLPNFSHEVQAIEDISTQLLNTLDAYSSRFYAVVVNCQQTVTRKKIGADLIFISQFGLGIIELKGHPGIINCRQQEGNWLTNWQGGKKRINAGANGNSYKNPFEQVRSYASQIRDDLINATHPWLPGQPDMWKHFKFHTAVCFTHPAADITNCRKAISEYELEPWHRFAVLMPADVPGWAASLRFEAERDQKSGFMPYCWTPEEVSRIATEFFCAREWREMEGLLHIVQPYAYMKLIENGSPTHLFNLSQNKIKIGRDPNSCQVQIPDCYENVSRVHAHITRSRKGIFIEDVSKNGTYVEGERVGNKPQKLQDGQKIVLCPPSLTDKACVLEFSLAPPLQPPPTKTVP